jgi:cobalt-zinc-cadmium resistance protein CzcA
MTDRILEASIRRPWIPVVAALAVAILGMASFGRLRIDAVPDITTVQVQINAVTEGLHAGRSGAARHLSDRDRDVRAFPT